jgi:secreted trypsin-like serine protease
MAMEKHTPSTYTEVTLFLDWIDQMWDGWDWLQGVVNGSQEG